jgi:hypothetical protein
VDKSLIQRLTTANGNASDQDIGSHWSRRYTIGNIVGSHVDERYRRQNLCTQ